MIEDVFMHQGNAPDLMLMILTLFLILITLYTSRLSHQNVITPLVLFSSAKQWDPLRTETALSILIYFLLLQANGTYWDLAHSRGQVFVELMDEPISE